MDEAALAEKGIAAILGNLDLTSALRERAESAMRFLSRCLMELAEAAGSVTDPGKR
jgi:hypothetical protein